MHTHLKLLLLGFILSLWTFPPDRLSNLENGTISGIACDEHVYRSCRRRHRRHRCCRRRGASLTQRRMRKPEPRILLAISATAACTTSPHFERGVIEAAGRLLAINSPHQSFQANRRLTRHVAADTHARHSTVHALLLPLHPNAYGGKTGG